MEDNNKLYCVDINYPTLYSAAIPALRRTRKREGKTRSASRRPGTVCTASHDAYHQSIIQYKHFISRQRITTKTQIHGQGSVCAGAGAGRAAGGAGRGGAQAADVYRVEYGAGARAACPTHLVCGCDLRSADLAALRTLEANDAADTGQQARGGVDGRTGLFWLWMRAELPRLDDRG